MKAIACVVLLGALAAAALPSPPDARIDLPDRLSFEEFWALSESLSEPSVPFISDNLVSNEMSFPQVIPEIVSWGVRNGVFIGVGPEQNFTYIDAMSARLGFVVDIRRENLLLHLLYKALFDVSPDRASFVGNLFGRPAASEAGSVVGVSRLMERLEQSAPGTQAEQERLVQLVARTLAGYGFPLSTEDFAGIERVHRAFQRYGPAITYMSTLPNAPAGQATFANLMRQVDANQRPLGFLASEDSYRFIREMQRKNLIVPVVGNFAGPKAIRGIGRYLRDRQATVSAFYVSNVEDYLGKEPSVPRNGEWRVFCENVAALPLDTSSVFIRPIGLAVFNAVTGWRLSKDMFLVAAADEARASDFGGVLPQALFPIAPEVRNCSQVRGQR